MIYLPNRPGFDNVHDAEEHEGSGPGGDFGGGHDEQEIHGGDLVPHDAWVVVNTDTTGSLAAEPDADHYKGYCDHKLHV